MPLLVSQEGALVLVMIAHNTIIKTAKQANVISHFFFFFTGFWGCISSDLTMDGLTIEGLTELGEGTR